MTIIILAAGRVENVSTGLPFFSLQNRKFFAIAAAR